MPKKITKIKRFEMEFIMQCFIHLLDLKFILYCIKNSRFVNILEICICDFFGFWHGVGVMELIGRSNEKYKN